MMHSQFVSRKGAVIAAVQFLNTVTEDNPTLGKKFSENPNACGFLVTLLSVKTQAEGNSDLVRILVASPHNHLSLSLFSLFFFVFLSSIFFSSPTIQVFSST
jgi:hypothetical protein